MGLRTVDLQMKATKSQVKKWRRQNLCVVPSPFFCLHTIWIIRSRPQGLLKGGAFMILQAGNAALRILTKAKFEEST